MTSARDYARFVKRYSRDELNMAFELGARAQKETSIARASWASIPHEEQKTIPLPRLDEQAAWREFVILRRKGAE